MQQSDRHKIIMKIDRKLWLRIIIPRLDRWISENEHWISQFETHALFSQRFCAVDSFLKWRDVLFGLIFFQFGWIFFLFHAFWGNLYYSEIQWEERTESLQGNFFLLSLGPHEHMGQRFVAHNKMSGHTRAIFEFPPLTTVRLVQNGNKRRIRYWEKYLS